MNAPAIPPPPGQLVDIGGYRLHLHGQGDGGPAVVFEAGIGDCSLTWALVQPRVAAFTTAYTYDRAGLAWSEASPHPRTVSVMVDELHALLGAARVALPVILVAHSFGGLIARLYAHRYPGDLAGLVLVDGAHEDQDRDAPAELRPLLPPQDPQHLRRMGIMVPPGLPDDVTATYRALLDAGRSVDTMVAEVLALEDSRAQLRDAGISSLGALPLIALRHGIALAFPPELGLPDGVAEAYEANWQSYQTGFAALSSAGRVEVAEGAGHLVAHERPGAVAEAIRSIHTMVATPAPA